MTAALNTNATVIASAISVIMPGSRSASSRQAPWRNDAAAVDEHGGAEDERESSASPGAWRREPDRAREHVAPDERGDRQQQRDPELVAEHRDAVAGVLVVTGMRWCDGARVRGCGRRLVAGVCVVLVLVFHAG